MSQPLEPDSSFPPGRNDPCFCGSGDRFKHCCGSAAADRKPPHGLEYMEGYLQAAELAGLRETVEALEAKRFMMRDRADNMRIVPDPTRVCDWVQLGEYQGMLDDLVARAFADVIIPRTGRAIEWYEEPQLLRYTPGGYYRFHSDASYLVPAERGWRKAVDRDISMLIYLNDDFSGGELQFKRFNYALRPRAGMLVWFPSDMRYEHMAMEVTAGVRYAVVSWAAAVGVPRVQAERAKRSILWTTREKKAG